MKIHVLTMDTSADGRKVAAFATNEAAETEVFRVIGKMIMDQCLDPADVPPYGPGDWSDAWEYVCGDPCDQAHIDEVEIQDPSPKRIVIGVRGGMAELDDAENWPAGLELYLVDFDNDGNKLDGDDCSIARLEAGDVRKDRGMTGHYAKTVAEEWAHS